MVAWAFRPKAIPTVATVLMIIITASLGRWQLSRAHEKEALQSQYRSAAQAPSIEVAQAARAGDLATLQFRPVRAVGTFDAARQILVDNKMVDNVAGYHVVTPLEIFASGEILLVNRGWIARDRRYPAPPEVPPPTGRVLVEGVLLLPSDRFLELSTTVVQANVWQNLTPARFEQQTGVKVLPFTLIQRNETGDRLFRVVEVADFKIERHYGYAFQWFALCATLVVIYVAVHIKRRP
jgi:surfeit locus 1 family protein